MLTNPRSFARRVLSAAIAATVLSLLAACGLPHSAAAVRATQGGCQEISLPVSIPSGPASIKGQLCEPQFGAPTVVQVLVHGASYNRLYWDFPGFDGRYSYVQRANQLGYATLAIDRLGTGRSTRPPSDTLDFNTQVNSIHQVVQAVRAGVGGTSFPQVELIGHSFGSAYSLAEAATYHDVNAVILTGNGHAVSDYTSEQLKTAFYPANHESRFADLDSGYLTSRAGERGAKGNFYDRNTADAKVIDADEATKDVESKTAIGTRPANLGTLSRNIDVPVLIANGQQDTHYCGAGANDCSSAQTFYDEEKPYYQDCLAVVLFTAGHDLNLHYVGPAAYVKMLEWSRNTIPADGSTVTCSARGPL